MGIAPLTALRTLYDMLELPEPLLGAAAAAHPPTQRTILIAGGATSVGQYAVQFAKLSGLRVIATASERNFGLVRSLGADVVVDYHDPVAAAKQIREAAPNLECAADCVAEGTSREIVATSLGGQGTLAHITSQPYPRVEGVRILSSIVYDFIGKVRSHPNASAGTPTPFAPRPLQLADGVLCVHAGLRLPAAFHRVARVGGEGTPAGPAAVRTTRQGQRPSKPGVDPAAWTRECRRRVSVHV